MTKLRMFTAGLMSALLIQAAPAKAEDQAYTPGTLKIQNSRALIDRYLPPPVPDPMGQDVYEAGIQELTAAVEPEAAMVPVEPVMLPPLGDVEQLRIPLKAGALSSAVSSALHKTGLEYEASLQKALSTDAFPRSVSTGDTLILKVGHQAGELVLHGIELLLASEATPLRLYRFVPDGEKVARYFDAQGYEFDASLLNSPLRYKGISSYLGDGRNHKGLDLRADVGTPIHTPFRAQVERTNWYMSTQGKCVQLLYVDLGIRAKFFHLNDIDDDIQPGVMLEAGEEFARSGNTGRSTGPHLHYQLEDVFTDAILNPVEVHGIGAPRLAPRDLAAFEAHVSSLETPLEPLDDIREASFQPDLKPDSEVVR